MRILEAFESHDTLLQYINEHDAMHIIAEVSLATETDINTLCNYPVAMLDKKGHMVYYKDNVHDLKNNFTYYRWLYDTLSDNKSKDTLIALLKYRLVPNIKYFQEVYSRNLPYIDNEIINYVDNEAFVECNDSIDFSFEDFIDNFPSYKKIYVYSNNNELFDIIESDYSDKDNIKAEHAILSETNQKSYNINKDYNLVTLDNDMPEEVTFLKINLQKDTVKALEGARKHMKHNNIKIAVNTSNSISDIVDTAKAISKSSPDFKFYLRHYSYDNPDDTVLYAVKK